MFRSRHVRPDHPRPEGSATKNWVFWGGVLIGTVAAMVAVRGRLDKAHVALILLLIVLGGSAAAGRALGLALSAASFLVFNWFFLPPYGTFVIADPLDWLVLVAFLITSVVAAQLLYRAKQEARSAESRAAQVDRMATLGAETLNAPRAADALGAVTDAIKSGSGVASCEISLVGSTAEGSLSRASGPPVSESIAPWVAANRTPVAELDDGTMHIGGTGATPGTLALLRTGAAVAASFPLIVRERTVGVLRLADPGGIKLDEEKARFVDALSYYGALAAERVALASAAEHAEALKEADRLKDALLASVSHDLRTPLTAIKALARELSAHGDEKAEIIEQEADRLNRFVTDLLDLTRISAGALPLDIQLTAVDDLIGAVVQAVAPSIGETRLRASLPPGDILVGRFDLVHSVRILTNLVENAAKYSEGPIDLTVRAAGETVTIDVSDLGAGIPSAERSRIFEPFRQGDRPPRDKSGAGLGLAIARQLAEAQRGRVTYHERPGGGSVFRVELPATQPAEVFAAS